ncbi:hypothetical protein [Paraprevotella clara]
MENTNQGHLHTFFLSGFQHGKARKMDVSTSENLSQEIEKSFAAERKIVRLTLQKLKIQSLMPTTNGT